MKKFNLILVLVFLLSSIGFAQEANVSQFNKIVTSDSHIKGATSEHVKSLFPPVGLKHSVHYANQVNLKWHEPMDPNWLHWDNGENNDGIGLNGGGTFIVASRWTPAFLTASDGKYLTKVKFFAGSNSGASTFEVRIWTGANATNLVTTQAVTNPIAGEWNTVVLDNPVLIDASVELWFGYNVVQPNGAYPAGTDAGPANAGFGDMISQDNGATWDPLSGFGLDYNWNIWAYVSETPDGKAVAMNSIPVDKTNTKIVAISRNAFSLSGNAKTTKAIQSRALLGYNVYKDDVKINTTVVETTNYQDVVDASATYSYYVKAVYTDGESESSNVESVVVDLNQVERNVVIIEDFTGTWCQYCPGAANGIDDMLENDLLIGAIAYHSGSTPASLNTTEGAARIDYYNVDGFPTVRIDGVEEVVGGGAASSSMYSSYLPIYQSRLAVYTPVTIELQDVEINGNTITANVVVTAVATIEATDLVLHVALTESHIAKNWQGMSEVNHVERAMFNGAAGTSIDLSSPQTIPVSFTVGSTWNAETLELVALVQSSSSMNIFNAAKEAVPFVAPDTYSITFTVKDDVSNPIAGATVTVNGNDINTDAAGQAVFVDFANGAYNYTISKTGYIVANGSVTVDDANVNEDVSLVVNGISTLDAISAKVFPNPASDYLTIQAMSTVGYEIYNVSGALVLQGNTEQSATVNISTLGSGNYVIVLSSGAMKASQKIVID
ncbi:MAG: T9SS type A sorting domain-containing protein [Salinivirgaceae bacterium]|nr:T9SS type A sorting domain-containing protein [Salinivirgaceae bacterium]